jgi:hypothetical protein
MPDASNDNSETWALVVLGLLCATTLIVVAYFAWSRAAMSGLI